MSALESDCHSSGTYRIVGMSPLMAGQGYEAQSSGGGVYSLGAVSNFTARRSMQMFSHNSDRMFSARRARKRVLDELRFGNSRISPIVYALATSTE